MPDTNYILNILGRVRETNLSVYLENDELKLKVKKGCDVPSQLLDEIKEYKTEIIKLLREREYALKQGDIVSQQPLIPYDRGVVKKIPLSFTQKRLWFIDQLEGSTHYHIPILKELIGEFDAEAFDYAWHSILKRHEIFRTVFRESQGELYQEIMPPDSWRITYLDAEGWKDEEIVEWVSKEISTPFDLSRDYLVRVHVLKLSAQRTGIVILYHHIVIDGWSLPIVDQEYFELYNSYRKGEAPNLSPVTIQYGDYAIWQQQYLNGEFIKGKIKWWTDYLAGVTPLDLPLDFPRPPVQSTRGAFYSFSLDRQLSDELRSLSKEGRATLFMTLLAGLNILLHRYTGQVDICVGTPAANRTHMDMENVVGCFINSLALRNNLAGTPSFRSLLKALKENTLIAFQYQDIPVESVIEHVVKDRDLSYRTLFQVLFVLQNTPAGTMEKGIVSEHNVEARYHSIGTPVAKFDISFIADDTPSGIGIGIEFCADLFKRESIKRMAAHFEQLMRSIVQAPDMAISKLPMLTGQEVEKLLAGFNDTQRDVPQHMTILDLFDEQVRGAPEAVAIISEEGEMDYNDLDARSNRLAHYLREAGVTAGTLVALSMEHSAFLIVSLLGILKAGGTYVPVDPAYPQVRKNFLLENSEAAFLVGGNDTLTAGENRWPVHVRLINLDSVWERLESYPATRPEGILLPEQLAYVIYTSGSTGRPKGVMITHHALLDYTLTFKAYFSITSADRVIQQSSISFDTMVEEIYPALVSGASIIMIREGGKDMLSLKNSIEDQRATILSATPIVLEQLGPRLRDMSSLRYVISGGDLLLQQHIAPFFGIVPVVNTYGPSESTVCATYHEIKDLKEAAIIGKPINNREIYILSSDMELAPLGVKGEICIGGEGLSKGYLGNRALTEEKFVDNPFKPGRKLYRTGDVGKYLPDGRVVFLGRSDDQVKFRGYRIEVSEIEHILREHDQVENCAVTVFDEGKGRKHLVAYVVPKGQFDKRMLQFHLRDNLPYYMVPDLWVEIEKIPLNANDKVDRSALPDPDTSVLLANQFTAPGTKVERKLVEIWQELLGVAPIGIHDNFFELGGHSIKVMEVVFRMEEELSIKVPVRVMFETGDIESLARFINTELGILNKAADVSI